MLAEKLQDTKAKDEAVTAIFHLTSTYGPNQTRIGPWVDEVRSLYQSTPDNCSLRRLVVAMYCELNPERLASVVSELPENFLRDLSVALRRQLGKSLASRWTTNGLNVYLDSVQEPAAE